VEVNDGTMYVGTDSGLGATTGSTYVMSGATLSLYLGVTVDETFFVNGGTLENFIGNNTLTDNVMLAATAKSTFYRHDADHKRARQWRLHQEGTGRSS
jgi:hypothetical protein